MKINKDFITGIIFSQFDEKVGPVPVAWIPLDLPSKMTDYISFKSMNILSSEEGLIPKSLAIIPFPSQKLKGLIKSLEIKDLSKRGGAIDSSLTVIFKETDSDIIFYKNIDVFENLFDITASSIIDLVESSAHKDQLQNVLNGFYARIMETFINYFMEKPETKKQVKRSTLLLFNLVNKNLDKAVNALILNKPVFVTGDKALVEIIIDTLSIFSLNTNPKKIYWTKDYVQGDLIGGPSNLFDVYKTEVCLDLTKGKVSGGNSNKFCKDLLKKVSKLDSGEGERIIQKELQKFSSLSNDFITIIKNKQKAPENIAKFVEDLDLNELEFIDVYVRLKHPELSKEIKKLTAECKKKISKIISGFEKQKW